MNVRHIVEQQIQEKKKVSIVFPCFVKDIK